ELGTDVADPLNPNIVYASGSGIVKITYPSEQTVNVSPSVDADLHLRNTSTNPLIWSPWDQHQLFAGFQFLMSTIDGGVHWTKLSPDLGYPKGVTPPPDTGNAGRGGRGGGGGRGGPPPGGSIESISPSSAARGVIWVGTNNGLIKMTRDGGKTWEDASIRGLPDSNHADISAVDASHLNPAEAYAAVDLHTIGDYKPYLYRTTDYGRTWTEIINGLPSDEVSGSFARVIRADTKKAGLLFAGTESSMYVSFDDGDNWQSLRLNLPTVSFRDAVIKGNDLVVGTYGRGIYILDDISPLRQMTPAMANEAVHLFKPGDAIRVRRNVGHDTPFPPEVPHSLNPPDGALIYYSLNAKPSDEITMDVLDSAGAVVRHLSSASITLFPEFEHPPEPNFWLGIPQPLPAAGTNRVNWNIRYDDPPAFSHSFPISANPGLTPATPEGPLALPGRYTVKLTVGGRSYTQTVTVRNDPRSPATALDLRAQHVLQMKIYHGIKDAWNAFQDAESMRTQLATASNAPADAEAAIKTFETKLDSVAGNNTSGRGGRGGGGGFGRGGRGGNAHPTLQALNGMLVRQLEGLDDGDMAPTPAMNAGWSTSCHDLRTAVMNWQGLTARDLPALNAVLTKNGLNAIAAPKTAPAVPVC
ncbi:MAG: WD40/YVTN/BNR-like repeat-containing protein, partial [Gemmatimonadales bacterium]